MLVRRFYLVAAVCAIVLVGCDDTEEPVVDSTPPDVTPPCDEGAVEECVVSGSCMGTRTCVSGAFTECAGEDEICDGQDNDCDGVADEEYTELGRACEVGTGACTARGTTICAFDGSGEICNALPAAAREETCDGTDQDCDGRVDEGVEEGIACDTGIPGGCSAGLSACIGGEIVCEQDGRAVDEICDGLDNDCDGETDESVAGGAALTRPCYAGDAATEGVGPCVGGQQTCVDGAFGGCEGQVTPLDEICDTVDNDCDGTVDEVDAGECLCEAGDTRDCYPGPDGTEGVGACVGGTQACLPDGTGFGPCMGAVPPSAEICNGTDDDCNGEVDDVDGAGEACSQGQGACRADGVRQCNPETGALECSATPGAPVDELCNGVDDDCDGQIDDVENNGQACTAGRGACAADGVLQCDLELMAQTCSALPGVQSPEICNEIDDDCDGRVDELAGLGDDCTVGVGACAATGTRTCDFVSQGVVCDATAGEAGVETCNGIDDDCNGMVDDVEGVGEACSVGVGACAADGTRVCGEGEVVCDAVEGAAADELCDGIDNDCDGRADEAGVCPEICGDGLDNDDDGAADCDDVEDCGRDRFCAFDSCRAAQLDDPAAASGTYLIRTRDGGVADLYCDMRTDGGGWTLVGATAVTMMDDYGVAYYPDLAGLDPQGGNPGIFNGLDFGPATDIRFACRALAANPIMTVDLSFYRTPWYAEFAAATTDAQSCFSEDNGRGFDEPPPQRRNNLTGEVIGANRGWSAGTFEGEDSCGDTLDFTVDFNDRGMKSNVDDGTDWGEDGGRLKCGQAGAFGGQWFVFVREVEERAPEVCDDGIDDDNDGAVDCADQDCLDFPLCAPLEGRVRLVDGFSPQDGRLEIYARGRWGTITDDNFGLPEADIACRQLGFPGARAVLDEFGGGVGTIWLDELGCVGDEPNLLACPAEPLGVSDGDHEEDVGVLCLGAGECRVDGQCTGGSVCVDGECFGGELCGDGVDNDDDGIVDCEDPDCADDVASCAECLADDGCDEGSICEGFECVPGCRVDGQCADGEICLELSCTAGCRVDGDCDAPLVCYEMTCQDACRGDDECGDGEICEDASCVAGCRENADCGLGRLCAEMACVDGCLDDDGCPDGSVCEAGQCAQGCRVDGDCGLGRICEGLECVDGCRGDEGCADGQICEPDLCVAGCRVDADCPGDDLCIDLSCGALPAEMCANGVDDDRDGQTDCDDPDCRADVRCALPIAAQGEMISFAGAIDRDDPTWDRYGAACQPGDGTVHPYDIAWIINDSAAAQRVRITGRWPDDFSGDGFLHVFDEGFDAIEDGDCLTGNSNAGDIRLSRIVDVVIPPGEARAIVVSSEAAVGGARVYFDYTIEVATDVYRPVEYCRLQFPESIQLPPGDEVDIYGRVYASGITDRSPATDVDPLVRGALGYGPDGSQPGAGWVWRDAVPNAGYDGAGAGEPENDEYVVTLTVPAGGMYDYAFRFSTDGGATVTYCDLDGNGTTIVGTPEAGYDPAEAGVLFSDPILVYCREACADAFTCELAPGLPLGAALYDSEQDCLDDCAVNPERREQAECIAAALEPPDRCVPEDVFACGVEPPGLMGGG